ncbi:MAG: tetratricopeptide repeat protein, partial [Planctomycetia bacterium]|nr:tetratricopeptide repeat protein [Planctomycetia bacterium]
MKFRRLAMALATITAVLLFACPAPAQEGDDGKAVDDYNVAIYLYNMGKYKLAAEEYQKFIGKYPTHAKVADARFGLGQSLFNLKKYKDAAAAYEVVRKQHATFERMADVLFQLAQTRVALGQFDLAAPIFGEVRQKHAAHYLGDWSMARQASCLMNLKKYAEAEGILKQFLAKYTAEGKTDDKVPGTIAMFAALKKAGVKGEPAFLSLIERSGFQYARAQFRQEKFADSEKSFQTFLTRYPKSKLLDEARFRLAQSLYQQDKWGKAVGVYKPVAAGKGEFAAPAGFEMALALYKAKKLKEASAAFAAMAKRFPKNPNAPQARLYAGTCLFEAKDFGGALVHLRSLAAEKKTLADQATYWVGMSLLRLKKYAEA